MIKRGVLGAGLLTLLAPASCEPQHVPPSVPEEGQSAAVLQEPLLHPESSLDHQPAGTIQPLPQQPHSPSRDEAVMDNLTTSPE